MEYRIKDYQISGNSIVLPRATSIEDIRLIYNETQKVLICSTAKKDNLSGLGVIIVNQFNNTTTINVPTSICVLQPNDQLTIKCDYGDEEVTETTLNSAKEEILNAVDNIKLPEIDTTELAKQGDNPEATLTAIYKLLIGNNEPSPDIPEGVAERLALILEFFGMKPIESYEFMTQEEVCSELEEIMTTMDINLTQEQAKEITNNTLNKE